MSEDKEELLIACTLEHQREKNVFVNEVISNSVNVLEVILKCYKKSVEDYHKTNVRFLAFSFNPTSIANLLSNLVFIFLLYGNLLLI